MSHMRLRLVAKSPAADPHDEANGRGTNYA
jgi:hypothetical protein